MTKWILFLRRNSRIASATSLSLVAGSLVALAIAWPGQKAIEANLNDGSVWINYRDQNYVGRLNPKVKRIDTFVDGPNSDIYQDGNDVLQAHESSLKYVDVANGTTGDSVRLGAASVAYGGRVLATIGGKKNRVWRLAEGTAGSFNARTTPAVSGLNAGPNGKVAVGPTGAMAVLNPSADTVTYVTEAGEPGPSFDVNGAGRGSQVTLVGHRAVVFDPASGLLFRDDERPVKIPNSGRDAKVQQPSTDGKDVYVATTRGLWRVPVRGGDPTLVEGRHRGVPAAPAVLSEAVHGAWREPGGRAYARHGLRDAEHQLETRHSRLRELKANADLVFRINRDVIVLNDAFNGFAWLVQDKQVDVVKTWDPIKSKKKENVETDDKQAKAKNLNRPPSANPDDALGARSGQAVILPVLLNDGDPDGDVLSIERAELDTPDGAQLEIVNNASQLQFKADKAGTYSFGYTINDGHGNNDAARGQVKVAGAEGNAAPIEYPGRVKQSIHPKVVPGSTTSLFLLAPMYDPDGDAFSLDCGRGKVEYTGGKVMACRADGMVTLKVEKATGQHAIAYEVTDGKASSKATQTLELTVLDKAVPETNGDRVVVKMGESVTARPLLNDRDPQGDGGLKLDDVSGDLRGIEIGQPTEAGTFAIRAPATAEAGPRYLRYRTHSGASAEDVVRVEVIKPPKADGTSDVVAVKDDARLRPGRTALVDVLANDYDRSGGTLVVAGIEDDADSGVKASVIGRRVVRLESSERISGTKRLNYRVSNGSSDATGQIVITGESAGTNLPPRAVDDDQITVKAGTIRSIDVLSNDVDPDGDELSVTRASASPDGEWPAGGVAFAAGRKVRVRAPSDPGQYLATYEIRDPDGSTATGKLKIDVPDTAFSSDLNQAPAPSSVTARAIKGGTVRIGLGLDGSDPDGDQVSLKTIASPPKNGLITESGQNWIVYEAHTAGQDHLRATVVDALGQPGTLDVHIGVANANESNQAPAALDDRISVRPGHRISYDVLANDSDLDGDRLTLDANLQAVKDANAEADGRMVSLDVPKQVGDSPESRVVGYRITDGKGGVSDARLTVIADENAPDYPPVAEDDAVTPGQVANKANGDVVTVDVLKNDSDPDGTVESLKLSSSDRGVSVSDHKLKIALSGTDRTVLYKISDRTSDGYGFVYVPGVSTLQPSLKPGKEVRYRIGDRAQRIDLADYIAVRPGRQPLLASFKVTRSAQGSPSGFWRRGEESAVFYSAKPTDFKDGTWTDAVTVRVKDHPDLAQAKTAEVSIPVVIEPDKNVNPTILGTTVTVGTADRDPAKVDLGALAHDPNSGDNLRFRVTKAKRNDPVTVEVKDDELSVAAENKARGGTYVLTATVHDGHDGKDTAKVYVRVRASAAPLIALPSVITRNGEVGKPTSVDIADYASVPGNRKMTLRVGRPQGDARVKREGTRIVVTPTRGGTTTVNYEVIARGLAPALGKLVVHADEPVGTPPGRPTAEILAPDSVQLTWPAAPSEGSPVTSYDIDANGRASSSPCGPATVCVVRGLKPGTPYVFRVRARIASSPEPGRWSPPSAAVTPTKQPDVMSGLTVVNDPQGMDKKLTLRWTKPNDYGSAITKYEILVNGRLTSAPGGSTTTTVSNLVNGTPYRFRIRAVNTAKGAQSAYSAETAPVIPFGAPFAGPQPTVTSAKSGEAGGNEIEISWTLNNAQYNGRPPTNLVLTRHGVDGGSSQTFPLDGSARSLTDTGAKNGGGYSYTLQLVNPAGTGPAGSASETLYPYGPAEAPSVSDPKDGDTQVTVSIQAGDPNGGELKGYDWSSDAGVDGRIGPGETTITALPNKPQKLTFVPITQGKGSLASNGELAGAASAPISVSPYGPPLPPSVSASSGYRSVNFSVDSSRSYNGRDITKTECSLDGGAWGACPSSVPTSQGGESRTLRAVAYAGDQRGAEASRTGSAQPRTVSVDNGGSSGVQSGCQVNCRWINISIRGFRSNTSYQVRVHQDTPDGDFPSTTITTNGNGEGSKNNYYYTGYSGTVHVTVDGVEGTKGF